MAEAIVILVGNRQEKMCQTPVNLPRSSEFILSVTPGGRSCDTERKPAEDGWGKRFKRLRATITIGQATRLLSI